MTLEQIAYLADIISGLAIVASLIYVGVQVKQNTLTIRSEAFNEPVGRMFALDLQLLSDPETSQLILSLRHAPENASELEWSQFCRYSFLLFSTLQNAFRNYREGLIGTVDWDAWVHTIKTTTKGSGFERFWKENQHAFVSDFRVFMDAEIIERIGGAGHRANVG